MDATMLSLVGCIIAFALLMILIMKNLHILIVALVCVTVVSLFSGMNLYCLLRKAVPEVIAHRGKVGRFLL